MAKDKSKADFKIQSEPETFQEKAEEFFKTYRDMLGYVALGIVVVVGLGLLLHFNAEAKEKQASMIFQNAVTSYQKLVTGSPPNQEGEIDQTVENTAKEVTGKLNEVIDNYPKTKAATQSLYLLGTTHLNSGQYQKAIDIFDQFIVSNPDHILVSHAKLGKATAYDFLNQLDQSISILEEIRQQHPEFKLADIVAYELAKRMEKKEDWEKARSIYQEMIDTYPDSGWISYAQTRLTDVNKKHPLPEEVNDDNNE